MNFLSALVTFENLHEVRRLCHWGPVIALTVIAICSSMAILDSVIWYWPLDTTGGSVNFIMLINWTVLILYNYFNAMFVGPGYIPLGWKPVRALLPLCVVPYPFGVPFMFCKHDCQAYPSIKIPGLFSSLLLNSRCKPTCFQRCVSDCV